MLFGRYAYYCAMLLNGVFMAIFMVRSYSREHAPLVFSLFVVFFFFYFLSLQIDDQESSTR